MGRDSQVDGSSQPERIGRGHSQATLAEIEAGGVLDPPFVRPTAAAVPGQEFLEKELV
jgi:hypothetical protein